MKILSHSFKDYPEDGWSVPPIEFGSLNLIVGISGAGKTRLLNTISNIKGLVDVNAGNLISAGANWDVILQEKGIKYHWIITLIGQKGGKSKIYNEHLSIIDGETEREIVRREHGSFRFKNTNLPKLSDTESAITLLKNEDEISPLFNGFNRFIRRELSIPSLKQAAETHIVTFNEKEELKKEANIDQTIQIASLNDRLDILNNSFHDIFEEICNYYTTVFPFVRRMDIKRQQTPFGMVPVFCIKETKGEQWIPLSELSSGMQKILFLLTDICSLPDGSIYFIDEYENSLGINAINIIPELLFEYKSKIQFFITSHHPYLINNIPVKNWYICFRSGQNINVKYGTEIEKKYGPSKQTAFVNLMNDPLYSDGVE